MSPYYLKVNWYKKCLLGVLNIILNTGDFNKQIPSLLVLTALCKQNSIFLRTNHNK